MSSHILTLRLQQTLTAEQIRTQRPVETRLADLLSIGKEYALAGKGSACVAAFRGKSLPSFGWP